MNQTSDARKLHDARTQLAALKATFKDIGINTDDLDALQRTVETLDDLVVVTAAPRPKKRMPLFRKKGYRKYKSLKHPNTRAVRRTASGGYVRAPQAQD